MIRMGRSSAARELFIGTAVGFVWQCLRLGFQVLTIVIAGRTLGPSGFGAFAAITAIATVAGGLSSVGSGYQLLRAGAAEPARFDRIFGAGLATTLVFGGAMTLLYALLASPLLAFPVPAATVAALGASELVAFQVVYLAGFALMALARLSAASLFLVLEPVRTLETYALYHLGASVVAAAAALCVLARVLRSRLAFARPDPDHLREGFWLSVPWFTSSALVELDKSIALALGNAATAGIYVAAYRLATMFTMPVAAFMVAVQPRLFRRADATTGKRLLARFFAVTLGYSLVADVLLVASARLLPLALGAAFDASLHAARLMIVFLPLLSLRLVGGMLLLAGGRHAVRTALELGGLAAMVASGAWLVPRYGLEGVVAMVTLTEGLVSISMWLLLARDARGSRAPVPTPIEAP